MNKPFLSIAICFALFSSFLYISIGLALLSSIVLVAPSFAQAPQDTTYTGRLVDSIGNPLAGPVNLELRVFNAETSGTELYAEQHLGTALDATGGFSVQLGLGTSPVGTYDAALFSDVNRWLEVVADADVLTPRQIIGSVPWALIAQQANEIVPDPNAPRFEDCGDGTVADRDTGLQWEKKTDDSSMHDKDNRYTWTTGTNDPDGTAFTDFLARLNAKFDPANPTGCFTGRCDWRMPEISELQTILIGPNAAPGQARTCQYDDPCIDPDFAAVGGPTAAWFYWSASTFAGNPNYAWSTFFFGGFMFDNPKTADASVRAVRAGSCH